MSNLQFYPTTLMMRHYLTFLLCLGTLFSFTQPLSQKIQAVENGLLESRELIFTDSLVPKFNILERMAYYQVPAVSIAVINNGNIEWAKAYGFADPAGKRAADTETQFQVASISKSVNAFGVMRLVQFGKLSLEADIRPYLKTWAFPDNIYSQGKTITLKHLLSHTAGLGARGFMGYARTAPLPAINQILNGEAPANSDPVIPIQEPNIQFSYSGGGTTLIRKILDDQISTNYDSLFNALVFKPLRMKNSTFAQPLSPRWKNYAAACNNQGQPFEGGYFVYPELAPDGLWSTATDLAKFVLAIQASVQGKEGALLSETVAREMLTPVLPNSNNALGVFVQQKGGEQYFTHSGVNQGFQADYYGSFTNGRGVVVLTNSDNGSKLIQEIVNSVAVVNGWEGFYAPIEKKLIQVSEAQLETYAGNFVTEDGALTIQIAKQGQALQLTARRSERMYPIGPDTFFIASSPNDQIAFVSSRHDGKIDALEVRSQGAVMFRAVKKQ